MRRYVTNLLILGKLSNIRDVVFFYCKLVELKNLLCYHEIALNVKMKYFYPKTNEEGVRGIYNIR